MMFPLGGEGYNRYCKVHVLFINFMSKEQNSDYPFFSLIVWLLSWKVLVIYTHF